MSIPDNLAAILARIEAARKAAIAPAPQTRLVAVSKTVDEAGIRDAIASGPAPVRRKPGAGSARQIPAAESANSRIWNCI